MSEERVVAGRVLPARVTCLVRVQCEKCGGQRVVDLYRGGVPVCFGGVDGHERAWCLPIGLVKEEREVGQGSFELLAGIVVVLTVIGLVWIVGAMLGLWGMGGLEK